MDGERVAYERISVHLGQRAPFTPPQRGVIWNRDLVTLLHGDAMQAADRAETARRATNTPGMIRAWWQAYQAERGAALQVGPDLGAEPSRSVLMRSAASLAVMGGRLGEAMLLVEWALAGSPAEPERADLVLLRAQIGAAGTWW